MDINLTLVVQMLVFAAFVWFTMSFVWPPLAKALQERQDTIAEGLAAAEQGHRELELAKIQIDEDVKRAKLAASEILEKASKRAAQIIEEARKEAEIEAERISSMAKSHFSQEVNRAKEVLRKKVALLAVAGAEKILQHEISAASNQDLIDSFIEGI